MERTFKYWADGNNFYKWQPCTLKESFNLEAWLAMNSSLNMVKINPKYTCFFESSHLIFGDYKLYEMRNYSPIRNSSIRFLGNIEQQSAMALDIMSNRPIYQMWENLTKTNPNISIILRDFSPDSYKSKQVAVWDYIKFFFNNVAGKHGRFEIVETVEDVQNRINTFYELNPKEQLNEEKYLSTNLWEEALQAVCSLYNVNNIVGNIVEVYKNNIIPANVNPQILEIGYGVSTLVSYRISNILMVFRNSLFKADVIVDVHRTEQTEQDRLTYGTLRLDNEMIGHMVNGSAGQSNTYIQFNSAEDNKPVEEFTAIPKF